VAVSPLVEISTISPHAFVIAGDVTGEFLVLDATFFTFGAVVMIGTFRLGRSKALRVSNGNTRKGFRTP
jgi:hypothetical protein